MSEGSDKHIGEDQRLLGGASASPNLGVGIWQVCLQGALDSPGPGLDEGLRGQKVKVMKKERGPRAKPWY